MNAVKKLFRKIKNTIVSSYLCVRFPFLYPRNRFSGKHYNNWGLRKKQADIYGKWSKYAEEHKYELYKKYGVESLLFFPSDQIFEVNEESVKKAFVNGEYVMKIATLRDRFVFWSYSFFEKLLSIVHCVPTYNELDAMPVGWRKRFGVQMCKELKRAILHSGGREYMRGFRIEQIKEKYGELCVYVNRTTDEVARVISKYEFISRLVCVGCGEDAVKETAGYISPYCEKCLPKDSEWFWIDPIYGYSSPDKKEENKLKEQDLC